jgi:5-methylcytosine-specific restriction endonuclease McrA
MFSPQPKPAPRCLTRKWLEAERVKAQRAAYRAVTKRDGGRCRVCGKRGAEHHHVLPRSLGGRNVTSNLLLLCATCHGYRHGGLIRISGNADSRVQVWWDARISPSGQDQDGTR